MNTVLATVTKYVLRRNYYPNYPSYPWPFLKSKANFFFFFHFGRLLTAVTSQLIINDSTMHLTIEWIGCDCWIILLDDFMTIQASLWLSDEYSDYLCVPTQSLSCVQLFVTPWTVARRLFCPLDFSGKNTWVGCFFLLQGIFLTEGSNPCLLHWQAKSLPLSHLGSPIICMNDQKNSVRLIRYFSW